MLINDDHIIASWEIVPAIDIPHATLERAVAQERARRAALDKDPDDGLFNRTTDISLFDAMPAMWKNLSEIQHREISELVDSM